jgi:hypothetical protein
MPGKKFRYRIDYRAVYEGTLEVNADNDMEASDCLEEACIDGELDPTSGPEAEVVNIECLDKGTCSKCGAEAAADLLAHTKGLCRACVR